MMQVQNMSVKTYRIITAHIARFVIPAQAGIGSIKFAKYILIGLPYFADGSFTMTKVPITYTVMPTIVGMTVFKIYAIKKSPHMWGNIFLETEYHPLFRLTFLFVTHGFFF